MNRLHVWLLLAVTALNLLWSSAIAARHLEPFADLATYYQEAQMLAQGKGFTQPIKINVHSADNEPPYATSDRFIYPIIVAIVIRLFGDSLAAANVAASVSMAITTLPVFALGRRLFDERAALVAAVFFALNPFYHVIGIQGWTDLTATLLYYSCLSAIAAYYFRPSVRSAILAGALCALATLTREESILLAIPIAVVWWRQHNMRHALGFALGPLAGFGLRGLYLYQTFGNAFYAERSYFFLPRWGLWYYLGTFTPQEYLDYVGGIGGAVGIRVYNVLRFVIDHFSDGVLYDTGYGMLPLTMLIGVAVVWRQRHVMLTGEQRFLVWLFGGLITLQILTSLGYPGYIDNGQAVRHGSVASPFILLVVSAGLLRLWQTALWGRAITVLVTAHYVIFAVAYLGSWGVAVSEPEYRGPIVLASEWAGKHLPANAILMTRRAAEAHYFSGRYVIVTPSAAFTDMMAFARNHYVTHMLITDNERVGTPNLIQGIRTRRENFQIVYSTTGAQIVAVRNYDLPQGFALPDELYAGKTTGRPARLYDWNQLQPSGSGVVLEKLVNSWSEIARRVAQPPAPPSPRQASVGLRAGEHIELVSYRVANSALQRGEELQLTLHWRALSPMKENYTVFAHLLDARGVLRSQKDAPPLDGARPTYAWEAGEWIEDHYSFIAPANLEAGVYLLEIGLYDSVTGRRLPLRDASGNLLPDDRLLIEGLSVR